MIAERLVESLVKSQDPILAYRSRRLLHGDDPDCPTMVKLRRRIRGSETAQRLLSHRGPDGTIPANPYKKWQGPHWILYSLALIDYPPGDETLRPLRDQVYEWLLAPEHMQFPRSLRIPGQEDRVRRCASQEGNAIWYSMVLGLVDDRTRLFVDRLIDLQWPDGGWNCDKRPDARSSSVIETLIPLRALMLYGRTFDYGAAIDCARKTVSFLLKRKLLYRMRDGALIRPAWGGDITRIHYPIRFYDVLFALMVMTEIGLVTDDRCADALDLLASKQLPDGGFPVETGNCRTSNTFVTRGSFAEWGPIGRRVSNPFGTVDALSVLRAAERFRKPP